MSVDEIRSDAARLLIEQMRDTMREAPGVGLAAPADWRVDSTRCDRRSHRTT